MRQTGLSAERRATRTGFFIMANFPPRPGPTEVDELRRRRRGRNWAIMLVLLALCALFYAITIVKMMKA